MTTQTISQIPRLARQHSGLMPWPTLDSRDEIRKSEYPEYERFFNEPVPDCLPSSMERSKLGSLVPVAAVLHAASADSKVTSVISQNKSSRSNTLVQKNSKPRSHLRRSFSRREAPLLILLLFSVVFALRY